MEKVSFSTRLQELMDTFGLTQADIVKKNNIPKSSVSQYLSGIRFPKIDVIEKLSDSYGVQESWLMGYDVPMKKEQDYSALDNVDTDLLVKLFDQMDTYAYVEKMTKLSPEDRLMIYSMIDRLLDKRDDKS